MNENGINKEQIKAAYALNLCAVSVSQIVDYQDINIMEQEYEAILNNLNLENMPKDQALLDILTQILNVITFFRIQEGDKKLIEKKYEQKMKDAIWKAIPNPGVFMTGLSPLSIGLSLAYSVGTGYMNYRNAKAENNLELEEEMWKLQRSAIEQLNALRRELFTTAWRLADAYNYPDEYRLTENQIRHYNEILMDSDPVRRYERLDYIKEYFEAYPAFWYHLGHAANAVVWSRLEKLSINGEQKHEGMLEYNDEQKKIINEVKPYVEIAKECFEKYFEINETELLRIDETVSTCALEYIDLLDPGVIEDKEKIVKYLDKAVKSTGEKLDILQLCAMKYIQIDMWDKAIPLLRHLVTEDYNRVMNGQILSGIFVKKFFETKDSKIRFDYELLKDRIGENYLFSIAENSFEDSAKAFVVKQRELLMTLFKDVLDKLYDKYLIRFNRIVPVVDPRKGDEYFTDENLKERIFDVRRKLPYAPLESQIINSDILEGFSIVIADLHKSLSKLSFTDDEEMFTKYRLKLANTEIRESIKKIDEILNQDEISGDDYETITGLRFGSLVEDMLNDAYESFEKDINSAYSMSDFARIESEINNLCGRENIDIEHNDVIKPARKRFDNSDRFSLLDGSDDDMNEVNEDKARLINMKNIIFENIDEVTRNNPNLAVIYRATKEMRSYISNSKGTALQDIGKSIVAVLDDHTAYDFDLVFTTSGIIPIHKGKIKAEAAYEDIERSNQGLEMGSSKYDHNGVDFDRLYELIQKLNEEAIILEKRSWRDKAIEMAMNAVLSKQKEVDTQSVSELFESSEDGKIALTDILFEYCDAVFCCVEVFRAEKGAMITGNYAIGEFKRFDHVVKVGADGRLLGESTVKKISPNTYSDIGEIAVEVNDNDLGEPAFLVKVSKENKPKLSAASIRYMKL